MLQFRTFLSRNLWVCALILALALAMKAFVPAGFMIGSNTSRVLTVEICDGQGHTVLSRLALPGKPDPQKDAHTKAAKDCPFTALSAHALSGADPVQLALALAFILLLGFQATERLRLVRARYHVPPLRAPPVLS